MKPGNKTFLMICFVMQSQLLAHCQIPCGIYDDALRIVQLREDFRTIEKAMNQIKLQQGSTNPQDLNQSIRWVQTKEEHAARIQETVSTYFLIQRIKAKTAEDENAYNAYAQQTTNLHQLMVTAMKCKQTVDDDHVQIGLKLLDNFVNLYFDEHGRNHLKAITDTL